MNSKYGVNIHEGYADVILGDGRTGVGTVSFVDGTSGIYFCRDGNEDKPFGTSDADFIASLQDKVVVRADNLRSIQVIIDRLEGAKELLEELTK